MIDGKRVLGIIPARGGSKGIPRKNLKALRGRPLIAWTIEAALASKYLDKVIVSTDDAEISEVAKANGAEIPFLRPPELATDTASSASVLTHALNNCRGYEYAVLLQPTSPLRKAADIDACLDLCVRHAANSAVSVKDVEVHPAHMFTPAPEGTLKPFLPRVDTRRRQDLPPLVALNGAVYVVNTAWFLENQQFVATDTRFHLMPAERSLDVDEEADLSLAEYLLK